MCAAPLVRARARANARMVTIDSRESIGWLDEEREKRMRQLERNFAVLNPLEDASLVSSQNEIDEKRQSPSLQERNLLEGTSEISLARARSFRKAT